MSNASEKRIGVFSFDVTSCDDRKVCVLRRAMKVAAGQIITGREDVRQ